MRTTSPPTPYHAPPLTLLKSKLPYRHAAATCAKTVDSVILPMISRQRQRIFASEKSANEMKQLSVKGSDELNPWSCGLSLSPLQPLQTHWQSGQVTSTRCTTSNLLPIQTPNPRDSPAPSIAKKWNALSTLFPHLKACSGITFW